MSGAEVMKCPRCGGDLVHQKTVTIQKNIGKNTPAIASVAADEYICSTCNKIIIIES